MSTDPISRLRRLNPVSESPDAPPISRIFERIDGVGAESSPHPPAPDRRAPRGRGGWGWRALPLSLAVMVSVAVAVLALTLIKHRSAGPTHSPTSIGQPPSGLPPVPQLSPANVRALDRLGPAYRTVLLHHPTCRSVPLPTKRPRGAPPAASELAVSLFGVLGMPANIRHIGASAPYGPAARIAQRAYGTTVVVAPAELPGLGIAPLSARCARLVLAAVQTQMIHQTAGKRADAVKLISEQLADERYVANHPVGICLFARTGVCTDLLYAQARGILSTGTFRRTGTISACLIPNGVAKITASYPAQAPAIGAHTQVPAVTITAPVIHNVAVYLVGNRAPTVLPRTITWQDAKGRTLRVTYRDG